MKLERNYDIKSLTTPAATGGTITTVGNYRIHTFTSSGTFAVNKSMNVEYLVIAGGGGGGDNEGSGGGAGGYRSSVAGEMSGGGASAESPLAVTPGNYTVTIGTGGCGTCILAPDGRHSGGAGGNSVFGSITSIGGGGGHAGGWGQGSGYVGGSGGGASAYTGSYAGGAGTANQGYKGSDASGSNSFGVGAGGGAGGAAANVTGGQTATGGIGLSSAINGTPTTRATGGTASGSAGTSNTGNGGSGALAGGSGIVIIRYLSSYDITATSMTVSPPSESPCRAGICTVGVSVTWTNNGLSTSSFVPSITVSSGTVTTYSSQNLDAGASVTLPFTVSGMAAGTCSICPNPN
jgi:hypothetical protein